MDLQPQRKIGPTRRSVSGIHVFRKQTGIPWPKRTAAASTASPDTQVTNQLRRDTAGGNNT